MSRSRRRGSKDLPGEEDAAAEDAAASALRSTGQVADVPNTLETPAAPDFSDLNSGDMMANLMALKTMKESGAISEADFKSFKAKILAGEAVGASNALEPPATPDWNSGEVVGLPSTLEPPPERPHSPATEIMDEPLAIEDAPPSDHEPRAIEDKPPSSNASVVSSELRLQQAMARSDPSDSKAVAVSGAQRAAVEVRSERSDSKDTVFSSELRFKQQAVAVRSERSESKESVTSSELRQQQAGGIVATQRAKEGAVVQFNDGDDDDDDEKSVYSSELRSAGSGSEDTFDRQNSMYAWQRSGFDDEEEEEEDDIEVARVPIEDMVENIEGTMVKINSHGMLSFMCFAVLWVFSAAGLMLALTWHYVWVEVTEQANLAAQAAVEQGNLHASEVLSPVTTVARTVDLAFRGGSIINNLDDGYDYDEITKVLEPFFQALPDLREVEIADSPQVPPNFRHGSIVLRRKQNESTTLEMTSDRGDCINITSGRGCSLVSHSANSSGWYASNRYEYPDPWSPAPLNVRWRGPFFSRNLPHEAICDDVCWSPSYSLGARIAGTTDPAFDPNAYSNSYTDNTTYNASNASNTTAAMSEPEYDPYTAVIIHVAVEATILTDVVKQIETATRGEAVICTPQGDLVATTDMAAAQTADEETGEISMGKVTEYARPWVSAVREQEVEAGLGETRTTGDGEYLVSAWILDSPLNATKKLQQSLRVVIAIPSKAYADSVLQSMHYWYITVCASPVVLVLVVATHNFWYRYCRKTTRELKDMDIEELKAIARHKKAQIREHRQAKKELAAQQRHGNVAHVKKSKSNLGSELSRTGTVKSIGSRMHMPHMPRSGTGMSRFFRRGKSGGTKMLTNG